MKRRRRPKARRACDVVSCLRADPAPTPTAGASAQSRKPVRVTTGSFAGSTTGCSGEAPAGQKTTRAFGGARAGGIAAADRSTSRPRLQHERETVRRPTSHERAVRVLAAPKRTRTRCVHIPPYRSSKTTRALRAGLRLGPRPDTVFQGRERALGRHTPFTPCVRHRKSSEDGVRHVCRRH